MKISILILTHNRPTLFTRAITSVLDNLPKCKLEILINNDTSDIVKIYNDQVPIKYYNYQNNDLSHIYKFLLEKSVGEFVYYLEDDDYLRPIFFSNLDFSYDINYMEYISEPLIRELGVYNSIKKISKNRNCVHKNLAQNFVEQFDPEEFQLGQIVFRRTLVNKFPTGNLLNNDYNLFSEIAKPGVTFKYIDTQTWIQTTDGRDNISFPSLNVDKRFGQCV